MKERSVGITVLESGEAGTLPGNGALEGGEAKI